MFEGKLWVVWDPCGEPEEIAEEEFMKMRKEMLGGESSGSETDVCESESEDEEKKRSRNQRPQVRLRRC